MDYTCRTRTLQSLSKSMEKETILLSHKLQRPEGQWNRKQKSDLIDSLLRKYPINATYGIKEDGTISIIDGVQRLSTVRDFLSDKFALSKDMDSIEINGQEKNLAGLKFSKLDEDVKDTLLAAELQVYELTDCTEKDVREIFRRQNAGKPLNSKHLRVIYESDEFNSVVYNLSTHPFMVKLMSPSQRKSSADKDAIVQTFMLLETNQEHEFTSFKTKDINNFAQEYADLIDVEEIELLKTTLDKFDEAFDSIKIPITSLPMILYSGCKVIKNKKSFSKLVDIVIEFLENYDTNEEYRQYVLNGTGSNQNVSGRFHYWKEQIKHI